jgi:hypothetical protein
MTLRCRPGDRAVVIHGPEALIGCFVEVLYQAPSGDFRLPDGCLHVGIQNHRWVVRFAHEIEAPIEGSFGYCTRMTRYAPVPDWALRPIRPDAEPVDVPVDVDEPVGVTT